MAEIETAWLIERKPVREPAYTPAYWGTVSNGELNWTFDARYALRFAREQDAKAVIRDFELMEACAVEHQFEEDDENDEGDEDHTSIVPVWYSHLDKNIVSAGWFIGFLTALLVAAIPWEWVTFVIIASLCTAWGAGHLIYRRSDDWG